MDTSSSCRRNVIMRPDLMSGLHFWWIWSDCRIHVVPFSQLPILRYNKLWQSGKWSCNSWVSDLIWRSWYCRLRHTISKRNKISYKVILDRERQRCFGFTQLENHLPAVNTHLKRSWLPFTVSMCLCRSNGLGRQGADISRSALEKQEFLALLLTGNNQRYMSLYMRNN